MTELKRCPFCGGEAEIVTFGLERYKTIGCKNCRVQMPLYSTIEETIEAWNNRPSPWHTGTPTEAGLYVIAFRFGNKIEHEIREMFYSPDYGMTFGIKKDIVAYQKIEPYRG